jgi:hypothetical protein
MPWQFRIAKLLYWLACKLQGPAKVNRSMISFACQRWGLGSEAFAMTVLLCANGFDYWKSVEAMASALWDKGKPVEPCERRNCIPDFVKRGDASN